MMCMKAIQFYIVCLLPVLAGCADDTALPSVPEGTPLTVTAEIGVPDAAQTVAPTRVVAADNGYDRSTFVTADRIRIIRTRGGSSSAPVDYTLSATGEWTPSAAGSELLFESGATYQAMYPADYSGIYADQRNKTGGVDGENYRNSNLLRTSAGVTSGATGVLSFTGGENAFVHRNTKLTLTFEGKNALTQPFAYMTVQGKGLYSGGTADEDIYLYRPDETKYTWHGILSPLTAESPTPEQKKVTVTVTDYNGVSYTASLTCERKAGSHYSYTLTLQNNILMPVGEEIKGWENGESHTGSLT